ncbi:sulfurtransferase complex subunit TusC [Blochmannia endosymbiont of Colobopsis nipponica]|uniref:sulfurtransferase complex subunit TusC n=1 Tax=Blochmannia endosymbiont of Colobopsis nipponica TaxID=2681987 RepID=UPI001786CAEE|nr:sulfurtransferase complex subunit TusC [Blochmannia endosymbiont of Colobopsis nipponica]QOI10907.1 sulfurtransferase complex subunit TusC [Blochmannia endosymbiont of Colobopsis nipponica]
MKKRIAFVFTQTPYGSSSVREGLDVLLSLFAFEIKIGVFFISDGIFILLSNQKPELILVKNFIATFGTLLMYDALNIYMCSYSVKERGFKKIDFLYWLGKIVWLSPVRWSEKLINYDSILTF